MPPEDSEEWHEALADGMLVVAGLHVSGVLVASFLHREHLTRAMLTGRKRADPSEANQHAWRPLAAVVLAASSQWTTRTGASQTSTDGRAPSMVL